MTDFAKEIIPVNIEDELKQSYLSYALSVIHGRALPDIRDGLKPVHRRILFAMYDLKNSYNKPYKKSARVVGDVIGKYHPHGDSAVYDAMVRMAQDFSLRYTLVEGQGNFGSIDGDPPAAMRYTEVRMAKITDMMLGDLEKETVSFSPNYTAGHRVRTQHGVSTSAEGRQKRGDVEILNYLQDAAGSRHLVFDLAVTHDRYGSSAQPLHNGLLTHPLNLDAPLHVAARKKNNNYRDQYANNRNITFMPAITSTSSRMHGEFLRLLFLQAHRETTAHFTAIGMPAQQHCDSFRFRRAAFYNGLKSKVGLAAAKTAAMRINLNIDGCGVVAPPVHSSLRAPHLLANLLAHNLPLPRAAH